jgi:ribonuclease HI
MPITKIFTDGSTLNNQAAKKGCSYGGYGGYIILSNGDEMVYSKPLEGDKITNQVAELMALKHGLEMIFEKVQKDFIYVYSDSMYVINIYTSWVNKWIKDEWKKTDGKPVENCELIKEINDFINNNKIKVFFKHVRAHQEKPEEGTPEYLLWYGNNKADELAVYSANISKERHLELAKLDKEVKESIKSKRIKKDVKNTKDV